MRPPRLLTPGLSLALALIVVLTAVGAVSADDGDYAVPGGRVFTQTAGGSAPQDAGFLINDDGGVPFWSEFQRLGGVATLGYPVTQRFEWRGFSAQATQKALLQWRPETRTVTFINLFDELSEAGYDDALAVRLIPPVEPFDEANLPWDTIVSNRLALLDASPPLKAAYFAREDPLLWYGLPTSQVVTYPGLRTIRLQRAVLQLWLSDMPWAAAGQVTVANGADLAKALGLFPTAATVPAIPAAGTDPIVARVNEFRATMGLPALAQSTELMRAAQAHADYYIRNLGDPNSGGLHTEVSGKPGFTGADIFARAKAAGYPRNWIDETFGFLNARRTLEWALGTVFHRYMFVHPSATDVGYGTASDGRTTVTIFNVGLAPDRTAQVPLPSVYPPDGATGVPPLWDGAESPDPAPGIARPLGPPITLQFGLADRIDWGQATLLDAGGRAVPAAVTTSGWRRALALVPHDPLNPATVYTVRVTGTRNGVPFSFQSSFTTRS